MEKEKNQLFLLLKKVTKVSVIHKYITINTSFCLDITSCKTFGRTSNLKAN